MVLNLCLKQEQALGFILRKYSCNPGIGSENLLWKVITRLQVISMYVLTTPNPKDGENVTIEEIRKRNKWDIDDYVYKGLILNGMSDHLFDIYQNVESSKELWDSLEAKYMAEDASSKKFLVSNFTNYKMTDSRPVMEQYNELLCILGRFTQHKMNMDETIHVSCIIDKLPSYWKDFKHTLKHQKEELTLVELGSHLRIEESLRVQDSDKPRSNNIAGPSVVNMVEHNNSSRYADNRGKRKHHDTKIDPNKKSKVTCWKCGKPRHLKKDCKGGKVGNKANGSGINGLVDGYTNLLKVEDASSKKFLVSNFANYKMTDSRPIMEQYNELLGILGRFTQHKMNMDETIKLSCIIDKLSPSWKDFKHTLKQQKKELTLIELGSHLRIEESLGVYTDNKGKRKHHDTKVDPNKKSKVTCWKCEKPRHLKKDCKGGKVGNKANGSGINGLVDGYTNSLSLQVYYVTYVYEAYFVQDDDIAWLIIIIDNIGSTFMSTSKLYDSILWHARLGHVHYKRMQDMSKDGLILAFDMDTKKCERGIECIFVGYSEHSKAFRFYVIELNESVSINSLIELEDAIFDENSICLVPRPSLRIPNRTKDIGGSVVPKEVTKEDGPKTFDEVMKSQDVAFWKESINNEMDSIMDNNTWVLVNLPIVMDVKIVFLNGELDEDVYINKPQGFIMPSNENKVDMTKEFLSSRFSMTEMGEADVILVSTPMDTSEKLMPNNGQVVSQLEYSGVIGCLMYAITCTRPDNAFAVGKLSRYTSNPVLEGYIDASWIGNTEYNSSTSGWLFLLGGGATSKEAEWLRNLILEIPLWSKPIAPISICCDSVATLPKAYNQMYNQKSRHLGVRHNMIYELIMNGVVSIEFVRSQHNLADHLTKGLARDLVLMCAEGVCLKSN
ncbi:zinc finger, CCHC-type containing protein [Tanacetum coccineum]